MKPKSHFAILSTFLLLSACATQRFDLISGPIQSAPTFDESQTFWIGGVGQSSEIDASKICGSTNKVMRIETQPTAGDIALSIITLGIYTPRHMRVICKQD